MSLSALLEKTLQKVSLLPESEQDALADEALTELKGGRTESLDIEQL